MKRIVLGSIVLILSFIFLTSCGQKQNSIEKQNSIKKQFIMEFELDINSDDFTIEELYNSYEGIPYEGISMYKIDFGSVKCEDVEKWDLLPLPEEIQDFITSTSIYVDFPNIEEGNYKFVNHNPNTKTIKNASLCVYDKENNIAYYLKMDT